MNSELEEYGEELDSQLNEPQEKTPEKPKKFEAFKDDGEPKIMRLDPATSPEKELGEDTYDIDDVVDKMLSRKDRKIPGSVYKQHAPNILLI